MIFVEFSMNFTNNSNVLKSSHIFTEMPLDRAVSLGGDLTQELHKNKEGVQLRVLATPGAHWRGRAMASGGKMRAGDVRRWREVDVVAVVTRFLV